jgi:hypothetical protein
MQVVAYAKASLMGNFRPIASKPTIAYMLSTQESVIRNHMRAEAQNLVDEIKQSIGLLRRHL